MEAVPAPARLWLLATSHFLPRCLHVVAELGVADHLGDAPRTAEALAGDSGCDAGALARMLRLLATAGVFEPTPQGWAHTELSRLLRSDHPQSMRAFARTMGGRMQWAALGELAHAARTGEAAIEAVAPGGQWRYFEEHPDAARLYDAAMTSKSIEQVEALLPAFDFTPFRVVADIGGGRGHLLAAVLEAAPQARGVLFDLPHVVGGAAASPRMSVQGGDFFRDPLPEADAYLLSQVLHDWDDAAATSILRAVRRAAPAGARLLVVEQLLSTLPGPHPAKVLDVVMLTLTGGRERSELQYAALLESGGFRLERIVPTAGPVSVLVAAPA